jgi:predicted ATPase
VSRTRARRFYAELRRRRVFRVLIPYAIAAWVLIQVVETTFPYIGLPPLAVTAVIVLAVAGFPVAALLSWVFDITPEGVRVTGPQATAAPDAPAPPLADAAARLPAAPGPLIGRDVELADAQKLLLRNDVRLLTLLGAAGTGKTRLALELARRAAPRFRDGARWVSLGATTDAALVLSAIGQAVGVGEAGTQPLPERVAAALAGRELLLVLDNMEHLPAAAPDVAALLAAAPGITLLATSRAPLRVRGERELPLAPLPTPAAGDDEARLRAAPAVRLFAERARHVDPGFMLDDATLPVVAAICRRLDGLPLAIELAAVRVKLLTPEAMLARLDRRLPLLTGGARDLPARHRTLREAIAWSHDLLDDHERRVLRRLAVFAGGCDVGAAEAVCGDGDGDGDGDGGPPTLDLLQALVDHSLVQRASGAAGEPRLTMLETIREYAAERLAADAREDAATRGRHLAWCAAFAHDAEQKLVGREQAAWLERLELEHDNFRAALAWSLDAGRRADGLHLAVALRRLWEARGHLSEGRRWLDALLADDAALPPRLRIRALYAAGVLADAQADYDAAEASFRETLALNRAEDDRWGIANALNNVGVMALRRGDHDAAHALYEESVRLWRELGNDAAVALALNNLGNVERLRGDHAAARSVLEESLAMHRARGDGNGCALTLGLLGDVARDAGDSDDARSRYLDSLRLFRDAGNLPQTARSLLELGRLDTPRPAALGHLAASLELAAELGSPRAAADAMDAMAGWAAAAGSADDAQPLAEAAEELRRSAAGRALRDDDTVRAALEWAAAEAAERSAPA